MVNHERHADDAGHDVAAGVDTPLSDDALLDLLDGLVQERGRVAAAAALGVNYRTLATCCNSRRVSRRIRHALMEFHQARPPVAAAQDGDDDDAATVGDAQALAQRVVQLEAENAGLRELVAERERQLEVLTRLAATPEVVEAQTGDTGDIEAGDMPSDVPANSFGADWRPPRRQPGMPEAGVVTSDAQPDEEHAFGPGAALVAQWRDLRNRDDRARSLVDRAQAAVRRWELEAEMLGKFHLTLPPDTFPLVDARRADQVRWRHDALAEARRELRRARRTRLMRRVLTLGLWRN